MAKRNAQTGDKITIKKYANRRLYNTSSSSYITLDDLAAMTREGTEFEVVDAKSGDDITHSILTQIIMDEEASGQNMLPVGFLRQLISLYGDSMQSMVPGFLDSSLQNFRQNQKQMQDVIENAITSGPFGGIAKTNIELMRSARDALVPGLSGKKASPDAKKWDDIDELKRQMADLQAKIDRLDNK